MTTGQSDSFIFSLDDKHKRRTKKICMVFSFHSRGFHKIRPLLQYLEKRWLNVSQDTPTQ
ncbi:hypothetical protein V6Z11_A07G155500 [Gossypium hirsutum]